MKRYRRGIALFVLVAHVLGCASPSTPPAERVADRAADGDERAPRPGGPVATAPEPTAADVERKWPGRIESLLPADTFVYLSIDDIAATRAAFAKTGLAAIWREEDVQTFLKKPLAQLAKVAGQFESRMGVTFDDVWRVFGGRVAIAVHDISNQKAGGVMIAAEVASVAAFEEFVRKIARAQGDPEPDSTDSLGIPGWNGMRRDTGDSELLVARCEGLVFGIYDSQRSGFVDQTMERMRAPRDDDLAHSEEFVHVRRRLGPGRVATFYVNVHKVFDMYAHRLDAPLPNGRTAREGLELLGLGGVKSVGACVAIDPPGIRTSLYIHAPEPRPGVLALLSDRPVSEETLRLAPQDAMSFTATRVMWTKTLETITALAREAGSGAEVERVLSALKGTFGVDLERDLLANLHEEVILATLPFNAVGGNPILVFSGLTLVLRARAPGGLTRPIDALLAYADTVLKLRGMPGIKEVVFGGTRIRYAPLSAGPFTFAPAVAIVKDRVIVAGGLGGAKELINMVNGTGGDSIALSEPVVEGLGHIGGRVGFSFSCSDTVQAALMGTASVGILAGLLLPAVATAREKARRVKCMSNLKQVGVACHVYAIDHNDVFPPTLVGLVPKYIADPEILHCPSGDETAGYRYLAGVRSSDPPTWVLAWDMDGNHEGQGVNCLFVDGHVEWRADAAEVERLALEQMGKIGSRGGKARVIEQRADLSTVAAAPQVAIGRGRAAAAPADIDWGELTDWVDLALVPPPRSYMRHLFPTVSTTVADAEGIVDRSYGPIGVGITSTTGVAGVGVLAGMLLPALATAREKVRRTKCMSNLKQIGIACHVYATDNQDAFPPDLVGLVPQYLPDREILRCPSGDERVGYYYVTGLRSTDPPTLLIAWDEFANHDGEGVNCLFLDGHVEWLGDVDDVRARVDAQAAKLRAAGRAVRVIFQRPEAE